VRKFAIIALLQALQHGAESVPIREANYDRTIEELTEFHDQYYRTDDMTIVIVGNMKKDEVRAVLDKYFADIPSSPEPPRHKVSIDSDRRVLWDIDASSVFLVYPGPFEDDRDNIALVAFGAYLSQYISMHDPEIPTMTRATYTTNPSYPLNNLPFFVFAQPEQYRSPADVRDKLIAVTDQAIASVDQNMFNRIKASLKDLLTSSFLEAQVDNYSIPHHRVIGQHAVNAGIMHYLRNGHTTEDYVAMIDSITFEEMQQILATYLSPDQRRVVIIAER
jgi:predicted Zn-dependent peptidase